MAGGQMRDIEGEKGFFTERAIARMQAMKTGALIRAAVRMGAILGGASEDELAHLTAYAEAAGRAFQLADDILDVTASPEAMGKATGKDAGAGKQTIVSRIGVEAAQRQLGEVIHDALSALLPFGERADGLRATATFFAERQS
jgi:farnesyl diphosphate synthase